MKTIKNIISYFLISGLLIINPFFSGFVLAAPSLSLETKLANITNGETAWLTSTSAHPGDTIGLMLKFRNTGDLATNIALADLLPAELSYASGSTKKYQNRGWQLINNDSISTSGYNFGDLDAEAGTQYIAFRATVSNSATPQTVINTAVLSADGVSQIQASSSLVIAVPRAVLVTESKIANLTSGDSSWSYSTTGHPGDNISVLAKVKNTSDPAYGVTLTASMPAGLSYVSGSAKVYQSSQWVSAGSDDIVNGGQSIGLLKNSDGIKYVSFHATVLDDAATAKYTISITASANNADSKISQTSVSVSSTDISSFVFSAPNSAQAGSNFTVNVTDAKTSSNQPASGTVIISLTSNGDAFNGTKPTLNNISVASGSGQSKITLVKSGTFTLKAVAGTATRTQTITVTPDSLTAIAVSPSSATVIAGETVQFTASGEDTYGNAVTVSALWSTNAGTISSSGLLTAQSTATKTNKTVTATDGSISDSATITEILPTSLADFSISNSGSVTAGQSLALDITALDSYGNTKTNYSGTVTLSSSDSQAVLPNDSSSNWANGQAILNVVLKTAGNQTVTIKDGAVTKTVTIIVDSAGLFEIDITPSFVSVKNGDAVSFSAAGLDQFGNAVTLNSVAWAVNDSSAGTIDQSGVFTAADISATFTDAISATSGSIVGYATVIITASTLTFSVSPSTISFNLDPGAGIFSQTMDVTLTIDAQNASYLVTTNITDYLSDGINTIGSWDGTKGFGWSLDGINFNSFPIASQPESVVVDGNTSQTIPVTYKLGVDWTTPAGNYQTTVTYTATAGF